MALGGAGPLHAVDVARTLGISAVIIPPAPGILCAQGLVVSDLKEDSLQANEFRSMTKSRYDFKPRVDID